MKMLREVAGFLKRALLSVQLDEAWRPHAARLALAAISFLAWLFRTCSGLGLPGAALLYLYMIGLPVLYCLFFHKKQVFYLNLYGSPVARWLLLKGYGAEELLYNSNWQVWGLSLLLSLAAILLSIGQLTLLHLLTAKMLLLPYLLLRNAILAEGHIEGSIYMASLPMFRSAWCLYNSFHVKPTYISLAMGTLLTLLLVVGLGIWERAPLEEAKNELMAKLMAEVEVGGAPDPLAGSHEERLTQIEEGYKRVSRSTNFHLGCKRLGSLLRLCPSAPEDLEGWASSPHTTVATPATH